MQVKLDCAEGKVTVLANHTTSNTKTIDEWINALHIAREWLGERERKKCTTPQP